MQIQIDSREHQSERKRIEAQFDELGIQHFCSKLYVGDYMNLDNPRVVVDRKQGLLEVCGNVTQQHERFRAELVRARKTGIKLIVLVEEPGIQSLEDVFFWQNPRRKTSPKATNGEQLFRSMQTMCERYGVQFEFCNKRQTGRRIKELLEIVT